jgi:DNA-binding transcriptional MocR family regulator
VIKPPKLRDQAAEQNQRYIVMNKLVIANRLPIETQIAKAFGVSRISVSEASKSLEFIGIVEKKAEWQLGMNSPSVGRSDRHGASCRGDRGTAKAYGKTSVCRTRGRGET